MRNVLQEFQLSLRQLWKSPAFTSIVLLTLVVSLGANTAVFTLINGILLRDLPYPEAGRLFDVSIFHAPTEGQAAGKSYLDNQIFEAWRSSGELIEDLAAYRREALTLGGSEGARRVQGARVTAALFGLLRSSAAYGRVLLEEDERPGARPVVVLGHALWKRRFGGDPRCVGSLVMLNGVPHSVVGVMPERFYFPDSKAEIWVPWQESTSGTPDIIQTQYFPVLARLREGVTPVQAETEGNSVLRGLEPDSVGFETHASRVRLVSLRDQMVAPVRPALHASLVAMVLVLVIACVNIANLLLARGASRAQEVGIRSALGGSRFHLVRLLMIESLTLSLTGGAGGLLLAAGVHKTLRSLLPRDIPRLESVYLDLRVFAFALLLSVSTAIVIGLLPALRCTGRPLGTSLRGGVHQASAGRRTGRILLLAETAMAAILLVGAGLLIRSFLQLVKIDPGFQVDHVLVSPMEFQPARNRAPGQVQSFLNQLLTRLPRHPDIQTAGVISQLPLTPEFSLISLNLEGQSAEARTLAVPQMTSPGYFHALRMRLIDGRWLTSEDLKLKTPVALVNETFVHKYLSGERILGRRLEVGSTTLEIVGLVGNVRLLGLDSEPKPELFAAYVHSTAALGTEPERLTLVCQTRGDPLELVSFVRATIRELDPQVVLDGPTTMEVRLSSSVAKPRFYALLLGTFAGLALLLSAAGLYGVLSWFVSRQTREIGVRRALGAHRGDILAIVLREVLLLIPGGILMGLVGAMGFARILTGLLFKVPEFDPLTYLCAPILLIGVALLASYLPARHALQIDPMTALRHE